MTKKEFLVELEEAAKYISDGSIKQVCRASYIIGKLENYCAAFSCLEIFNCVRMSLQDRMDKIDIVERTNQLKISNQLNEIKSMAAKIKSLQEGIEAKENMSDIDFDY